MALDFPTSPSLGQQYPVVPIIGVPQYSWDGEKWTTTLGATLAGAPPSVTTPAMDVGAGAAGASNSYARGDHVHPSDTARVAKGGDTMLGLLTLSGAPSSGLHAATKAYVDAADAIPVMPQATAVGKLLTRVTAGAGAFEQYAISELTALSPVAGDLVMGSPAAGGAARKIDVASLAAGVVPQAQGRLTFVSNQPQATGVTAGTVVFYTPYNGLTVPLWNGSLIVAASIGGELSQALSDATKSPVAAVGSKNYDVFVWRDPTGSVMRATRGPPWASDTTRGTGAGTTELVRAGGMLVNAQAITNGPASQRGTYVGTFRTNSSAQLDFVSATATGGSSPCYLHLWNAYNRLPIRASNRSTTASWLANSATGWTAMEQNNNHRFNILKGLDEYVRADLVVTAYNAAGGSVSFGVGLDSVAALSGISAGHSATVGIPAAVVWVGLMFGYHFLSALQRAFNANPTVLGGVGLGNEPMELFSLDTTY